MKKIYIAGPDVFEKDAIERGKRYTALCKKYGFEGLYPLDNEVDFSVGKKEAARQIFEANKKMIDACDIVIANLNPFRGKESDSGTVWECGYAYAKSKIVYGYMNDTREYLQRFGNDEKSEENGRYYDREGRAIEDFSYPLNLMLACSIEIIQGGFEDVLKVLRASA